MRGFARRTPVAEALGWLDAQLAPLDEELVCLDNAAGRVLARQIRSPVDVPAFARAMMDGYAVRAAAPCRAGRSRVAWVRKPPCAS